MAEHYLVELNHFRSNIGLLIYNSKLLLLKLSKKNIKAINSIYGA